MNIPDTDAQLKLITAHLESGKSITALEALRLYGCLRLGARIYDLRQKGMHIESRIVQHGHKRYAHYSLISNTTGQ